MGAHKERHVNESTEDFAAMFEASRQGEALQRRARPSRGRIVAIGPEVAFVDVGGKGEATIDVAELKDDEGDIEVAVGDRIQAMVVSTAGGLHALAEAGARRRDRSAARRRVPHRPAGRRQGREGGQGRIRGAHRPAARASARSRRSTRCAPTRRRTKGKVYEFRIIEYKEGGKNLVVSRRALLEEEQRASAAEVRKSIVAGAVMTGRVASVREFGAFVDLGGGVQGLLHVSEMGVGARGGPVAGGQARRRDHRQGPARRRGQAEDLARVEAAHRRSVVDGRADVRSRPGAHRPRDARRGLRRLRRARAGHRRAGARLDVRADRPIGRMVSVRSRRG